MNRIMKTVRGHLALVGLALALVAITDRAAYAQSGYEDAWSDEYDVSSVDPDTHYWGYSSTDCDASCSSQPGVVGVSTLSGAKATNTSSAVFASTSAGGGAHSDVTLQAPVPASAPDGDYGFTGEHTVSRSMDVGGFQWDDIAFFTGVIASIRITGIQNRYRFKEFQAPDRWVFEADDCAATCQTSSQYINYDPGSSTFLHRKVRRISIFGFGKCVRAQLTPQTFRGNCSG